MAVGQTRRSGLLRCRECRCADMNVRSDGLDSHMVVRGRAVMCETICRLWR